MTDLRSIATGKVLELQGRYLADTSAGVRALAVLRRSAGSGGSDPEVWGLVFEGLPASMTGRGDDPSPSENALHAVMCLYAFHQQSRSTQMHRSGTGLGDAVRRLHQATGTESTIQRFKATGSATSWGETLHHLRGIVTQLRGQEIPLDYGQLAVDLLRLQHSKTAPDVRRAWGRDLHRVVRDATSPMGPDDGNDTSTDISTDDTTGVPA